VGNPFATVNKSEIGGSFQFTPTRETTDDKMVVMADKSRQKLD
jgi:hypothetical protein